MRQEFSLCRKKLRFQKEDRRYRVLVFGGELVAGLHRLGFTPFAEGLESDQVLCDHFALSGWTVREMVDSFSLTRILEESARFNKYDLAVILAGTECTSASLHTNAYTISDDLWKLHQTAHVRDVPTLAISLPCSITQLQLPNLRQNAQLVNLKLAAYCAKAREIRAAYLEYPIPFTIANEDGHWSIDGVHMSEDGYKALGKALAPVVIARLYFLTRCKDYERLNLATSTSTVAKSNTVVPPPIASAPSS